MKLKEAEERTKTGGWNLKSYYDKKSLVKLKWEFYVFNFHEKSISKHLEGILLGE